MKELDFNVKSDDQVTNNEAVHTDLQIIRDEITSNEADIVTLQQDLSAFTVVTAVQDNAGTIEYKTRTISIVDGLMVLGTETDWIST